MVGVPHAADGDGVGQDVFRQRHAEVPGVAQMVDVGAGHLAHQSDPPEGVGVGPLLRGADGGDGVGLRGGGRRQ